MAKLELNRAGWQAIGNKFEIVSPEGVSLTFTGVSPGGIQDLLVRSLLHKRASSMGLPPGPVDFSPIKGPRAGLHAHGRVLATGALWTPGRLSHVGYILGSYCPHCGESYTLVHRLWLCPMAEAAKARSTHVSATAVELVQSIVQRYGTYLSSRV